MRESELPLGIGAGPQLPGPALKNYLGFWNERAVRILHRSGEALPTRRCDARQESKHHSR
jgi:hypothetical protein